MHALAIGYSPAYLSENADGLGQDWPSRCHQEIRFARLRRWAGNWRPCSTPKPPVDGVTASTIRPELQDIAVFRHRAGSNAAEPAGGDLDLTAGWGHAIEGGVTVPDAAKPPPHGTDGASGHLLERFHLLAQRSQAVWNFTIGGYQVIKKMALLPRKTSAWPPPHR